jgi:arylsulfatase A-like enzyme
LIKHKDYAFSEGGFLVSEEPMLEQAPYPYDIKAGLQHEDTTIVGRAISCRDKTWTYIYRLYEPPELYHRMEDAQEMHNLAESPEHAEVRARMEAVVLKWMVASSDFLPWQKDPRFPKVELEAPDIQWSKRVERR